MSEDDGLRELGTRRGLRGGGDEQILVPSGLRHPTATAP